MNTVESQAEWYANWVQRTGTRRLLFFPRRKSSNAIANRFRLCVLEHLVGQAHYHGLDRRHELDSLERKAAQAGYEIVEEDPSEYDPKVYRKELRRVAAGI